MIRMNVPGAFISPCGITWLMKPPKCVLKQFRYSYSGCTLVWKYVLLKSILLQYLDRPSAFRIVLWFRICVSSFLVLSLRAVRSTRSLILPSVFPWTNCGAAPGTSFRYMTPPHSFWESQSFSFSSSLSGTPNVGCVFSFSLSFNRIRWLYSHTGGNLSRIRSGKTSRYSSMTCPVVAIATALTSPLIGMQLTFTLCLR